MLRKMMIALAAITFVGAVVATSTADARSFGGGGFRGAVSAEGLEVVFAVRVSAAGSLVLAASGFALPLDCALASGPASPSAIASSSPNGALPSRLYRSASPWAMAPPAGVGNRLRGVGSEYAPAVMATAMVAGAGVAGATNLGGRKPFRSCGGAVITRPRWGPARQTTLHCARHPERAR